VTVFNPVTFDLITEFAPQQSVRIRNWRRRGRVYRRFVSAQRYEPGDGGIPRIDVPLRRLFVDSWELRSRTRTPEDDAALSAAVLAVGNLHVAEHAVRGTFASGLGAPTSPTLGRHREPETW
jgi:hypothetical protein